MACSPRHDKHDRRCCGSLTGRIETVANFPLAGSQVPNTQFYAFRGKLLLCWLLLLLCFFFFFFCSCRAVDVFVVILLLLLFQIISFARHASCKPFFVVNDDNVRQACPTQAPRKGWLNQNCFCAHKSEMPRGALLIKSFLSVSANYELWNKGSTKKLFF